MSVVSPDVRAESGTGVRIASAVVLVAVVSALFYYKWGASWRVLEATRASGRLGIAVDVVTRGGVLTTTVAYFRKIGPALSFGIVIGATVRTVLPRAWIAERLGPRGAKPTFAAALIGAPLMLCSCCVTPIFTGLHQRGARLGPALTMMLASPGLNVAALALTFGVMPLRTAVARLVGAACVVFVLSTVVGRRLEGARAARALDATCPVAAEPSRRSIEKDEIIEALGPTTLSALGGRLLRNVVTMIAVTVPLIVAGVVLSGLLLPHVASAGQAGGAAAVAFIALVGVLVALPTFFEIPIAVVLLALDPSGGTAVAFMIAGPIVNLPSLFVLARETHPKVSVSIGAGVWAIATILGIATSLGGS